MSDKELSNRPLCFVLMPFGRKGDAGGREIDFDKVYEDLIKPSIETLIKHIEVISLVLSKS